MTVKKPSLIWSVLFLHSAAEDPNFFRENYVANKNFTNKTFAHIALYPHGIIKHSQVIKLSTRKFPNSMFHLRAT